MTSVPVTTARLKLSQLIEKTVATHKPIRIIGAESNAILLSEEDWRSIEETLYLLSIPGMRESIRIGLKEPLGKSCRIPGF